MYLLKKDYESIKNSMSDDGMFYCNICETYFIVRNTNEGSINESVCPCCGVYGNEIEPVTAFD